MKKDIKLKIGAVCNTVNGSYRYLGRDGYLFKVRERLFDDDGNEVRQKTGEGFRRWTAAEMTAAEWED